MTDFQTAAVIVTLTAALAYLNARFLRLPSTIGLMAIASCGSIAIVALDAAGVIDATNARALVARADLGPTLLHGMLGLLLFAGALHIDLRDLKEQRWAVGTLAVGSTILSTLLVGVATYFVLALLGTGLDLATALLFGALISPTDPIAVLATFREAGAPHDVEVQISGESLFNDGVGVVLFVVLAGVAGGHDASAGDVATIFFREALGGAAFGLALGYVAFRLLRSIDDYSVEVLITLALVLGGYTAAETIHVSAPIAAVVAGLVIGNQGRRLAMSDVTREHVDLFWRLIDEILNAVLFLLIGLEATRLHVSHEVAIAAAVGVPLVLAARYVSVAVPLLALRPFHAFPPNTTKMLTWGGLRGGISIALALSLPAGGERDMIVVMTYAIVAWSLLVQGLTLPRVLRRLTPCRDALDRDGA
ncbi:MAG TPA: sodium:proton antiporter [Kofleriaceae bacterium]|nr:sodium:proton antiporter [Kofleriaceae bacterium]